MALYPRRPPAQRPRTRTTYPSTRRPGPSVSEMVATQTDRQRDALRAPKPAPKPYAGIDFSALDRLIKSQTSQGGGAPASAAAATPPPAPAPSPLDAEYGSDVARLMFETNNQRAGIQKQGAQDKTDFDTMLRRMAEQKTEDLLSQDQQSNQQGLFYSGQLGKRRGDVETGYAERQSDQQTEFDRRNQAREDALREIGEIVADPNSPLGYRGTGGAHHALDAYYRNAIARRTAADESLDPGPQADEGPSAEMIEAFIRAANGGGRVVHQPPVAARRPTTTLAGLRRNHSSWRRR